MENISVRHTRRSFLRTYRESPVEIRQHGSVQCLYGKMNDCCRGGMQLTTEQFLAPGSPILIRSSKHGEIITNGAFTEERMAKVLWCQPLSDRQAGGFSVGVQFTPPPHNRQPVGENASETEA